MLAANPANSHNTDVSLNRPGQLRGFNRADTNLAPRLGTKHCNIEDDSDTCHRNIGHREFKLSPAQLELHPAMQTKTM